MDMKLVIVGAGYVGLPLALGFTQKDLAVCMLDIDSTKIDALNKGQSYVHDIPSADIKKAVNDGLLAATSNFENIAKADSVIVCVPTPLGPNRAPNLQFVMETAGNIGTHLKNGQLVVLESTTYPGTTSGKFREELEAKSNLKAGVDFFLAFSPEREDPGNPASRVGLIPKIVGGLTKRCQEKALALYQQIAGSVVPVSSCEVAEATKLLENIYRSVNIAMVNELKVIYDRMGIDIWEVIEAAKTKPFGYTPFYPGPGLGGHCIPIDPFYLTWKAREHGQNTRFIELAGEINNAMPQFVLGKIQDALNQKGKALKNSKVLIVGLAYKPDVNDCRESPSFEIMNLLQERGAIVQYYDPFFPSVPPTRKNPHWTGQTSIEWSEKTVSDNDLAAIITNHTSVDHHQLLEWLPIIVDTRNVLQESEKVIKA